MSFCRPLSVLLFGTLALMPLTNCGCVDDDLDKVAPKIAITDPLAPDAETSPYCQTNNNKDCAFDFGDVPIGQGRVFTFVIRNPSPIDLNIENAFFADGSGPAFKIDGVIPEVAPPDARSVAAEEWTKLTVRFTPIVEGPDSADLIIRSDAVDLGLDENGELETDLVIKLTGNGVDLGSAEIVIEPPECDFGEVGVGATAFCDLTVKNIGERDLEIRDLGFSPDTPFPDVFGSQTIVPIPTFVAPGTGTSIRLYATPDATEVITGTLLLETNDPRALEVSVPLSVQGADAPTAVAEVKSINGVPNNNPSPQVTPLDDVILTAVNSVSSNVGGSITAWHWEIIERPNESSVELTDPDSMETGFYFISGSNTQLLGLDVAGTYVIALTVTDDRGLQSGNEATVSLNAIPQEAFHIQLTWDSPSYDYDLHVIKNGGPYCSINSCYYSNCKAALTSPEWDGIPGETGGDPSLDVDDLSGYGPENINIDYPADGTYRIAVHAYSSLITDDVWATLKIYINGALAYEDSKDMPNGTYVWEVAEVTWSNGAATIFPIDTYGPNQLLSNWQCGGF